MTKNPRLEEILIEYRTLWVMLFQTALICGSLVFAWLLRFEFSLPYLTLLVGAAPILVAVRLVAMLSFGLTRGWWRYAGLREAWDILKAVAVGSLTFWLIAHSTVRLNSFPRSIFVLEALLTAGGLIGVRLFSRAFAESVQTNLSARKKVIVIGAGFAAQSLLRELNRTESGYFAVGCLDDDDSKYGVRVHGAPVLGRIDRLPVLCHQHNVHDVLIAIPSATNSEMQRFIEICNHARVNFRTVPAISDIIAGRVSISELREVNVEDLLGRDPVQLDLESVRLEIQHRTVLVTGAAGSIGSEICRQLIRYQPAVLVCVDQSETGVFFLQHELMNRAGETKLVFNVADVCNTEDIRRTFLAYRPNVVFHAAAYKHVPLMEQNPRSAVENNVFALVSLLSIAEAAECGSFVLISSDKAVNPSSIMGATKRICEMIVSSRPSADMRCVSVRFGNVLGSSGSVIPVLQEQLRKNIPLTVTDPEICRYFMTTQEAVALVLQAFAIGNHGDILVLDMGRPVKILDLARSLVRLSGKSESSVAIQITGLRPGEKLAEELFSNAESLLPTSCSRIRRIANSPNHWKLLTQDLEELRATLYLDGAGPIRSKIKEMLPEFTGVPKDSPDQSVCAVAGTASSNGVCVGVSQTHSSKCAQSL